MDIGFYNLAFIILAAGLGKRMKSDKAKVLHEVLGKPMVYYVLETATRFTVANVYVIVGYQSEAVCASIDKKFDIHFVHQDKQLGTGHAVSCALPFLEPRIQQVVILCGDTPLVSRIDDSTADSHASGIEKRLDRSCCSHGQSHGLWSNSAE